MADKGFTYFPMGRGQSRNLPIAQQTWFRPPKSA